MFLAFRSIIALTDLLCAPRFGFCSFMHSKTVFSVRVDHHGVVLTRTRAHSAGYKQLKLTSIHAVSGDVNCQHSRVWSFSLLKHTCDLASTSIAFLPHLSRQRLSAIPIELAFSINLPIAITGRNVLNEPPSPRIHVSRSSIEIH